MEKAKAVIFDMDGTLIDSERLLMECWRYTAEKHGFDYDEFTKILYRCIGLRSTETMKLIQSALGEDFDFRTYNEETREIFHSKIIGGELKIKPGAYDILGMLKERGIPMALGTSTLHSRTMTRLKVAGMEEYFPIVVCGDMVEKSKPAPDIFFSILENLRLRPDEVFIIEDSNAGVEAAWRAGGRILMVPDVLPPTEDSLARCEAVFKDLFELKEYIADKLE